MSENDVLHQQKMRVMGGIMILSSIIQIAVSAAAYDQTSWHVGSWWAGVVALLCAIFALISSSKSVVGAGCAFSVLAIILCFIGTILDGVFYGTTENLDTCVNRHTLHVYGDSSYAAYAKACIVGHSQECACVNSDNTDDCYLFNLKAANDCGDILTTLPAELLASMFFLLVLLFVVTTYSIFTCMNVCCAPEGDVYVQDHNNGPAPAVASVYQPHIAEPPQVARPYVQPPPAAKAAPAATNAPQSAEKAPQPATRAPAPAPAAQRAPQPSGQSSTANPMNSGFAGSQV